MANSLNWYQIEDMPHAHISGGRVLRINKEEDCSVVILEMLEEGMWNPLHHIECDDECGCEVVVNRLKAYAEFLFLGPN
jgi:hypothetical protein